MSLLPDLLTGSGVFIGHRAEAIGPLGSRCVPVVPTRQPYVLKDAACVGEQDLVRQYLQAATAGRRDGIGGGARRHGVEENNVTPVD